MIELVCFRCGNEWVQEVRGPEFYKCRVCGAMDVNGTLRPAAGEMAQPPTGKLQRIQRSEMVLKIKKLHPDAIMPSYAHGPDEDAGMDLRAVEEVVLWPCMPALVKTGIALELPSGVEAQIRPRSGLALKHGITVLNSPGTVDPSYRGEIGVILFWHGNLNDRSSRYKVKKGDKIAQMVVSSYVPVREVVEVTELSDSSRGEGGFGSTGV